MSGSKPAGKGKKVEAQIKLIVPAQEATPGQKLGAALGQKGVNIMEFCKTFNAKTQSIEKGMGVPVTIQVYGDRSFNLIVGTPTVSDLLKKAAGLKKGSSNPNTQKVGKVTRKQLEEIAGIKAPNLTSASLNAAVRTIAGSARSMGLEVEGV